MNSSRNLESDGVSSPTLATRLIVSHHGDKDGRLIAVDFDTLPFLPVRAFTVCDVPPGTVRGGHAHRSGHQLLVCTNGRIQVDLRHNGASETIEYGPFEPALLVAPGVWSRQVYLDPATSLLVLCLSLIHISEPTRPY